MIDYINLGEVVNVNTYLTTADDEVGSHIIIDFLADDSVNFDHVQNDISKLLKYPNNYVLINVGDITKAQDELLKLKDRVKELETEKNTWKEKCGSVITDTFRVLSSNPFGVKFNFDGWNEDGNWLITMDFPKLDEAKKKISELESKLADSKSNESYWRDRKEEEEDYHHYWHYTFDRAVKKAAEKGIHIGVCGNDEDCNAGIVTLDNMKAEELEKRVVQMEDANQKLRQKIKRLEDDNSAKAEAIYVAKDRADYWKIKYNELDRYCDRLIPRHDAKWTAMCNALKAKGVEVIYMGEEDGKPIVDVKVPKLDELQKDFEDLNAKYINRGSKIECLELDLKDSKNKDKDNKYEKLFIEASNMKDYWYSTYYEAVRQSWNQGVSIRIDRANLKDNVGIVQVNNERAEELKKELEELKSKKISTCSLEAGADGKLTFIYTYLDGHNEAAHINCLCKNHVAIDAANISCGTIPKCKSCAHYMHNPSRFAHDWCYKPVSKEGPGTIRKLSTEEAEGPACSDFKARKE